MAKVTLNDPATLDSSVLALMAANNAAIETAMEKTLSRDGTSPNEMEADLDMDGHQILNLPEPSASTDVVRKIDLDEAVEALEKLIAEGGGELFGVPDGGTDGQVLAKASNTDGDTEWITVSGTGSVTSVAQTVPTGFQVSGSPITGAGTLAINYQSGYQGYTSTEASKLSGIEDLADVTDTANVTAAGALMDSEVTNLAAVKAFDPSAYATAGHDHAGVYQPLDSDLTAWAAVNPSSYSTTAQIAAAYQPLDSDLTSWAGVTRASGFDTFVATPSSANLASLVSDETGTGSLVLATGPTFASATNNVPAANFTNSADSAFIQAAAFRSTTATPAAADQLYTSYFLPDDAATQIEYGRVGARIVSPTSSGSAQEGELIFSVRAAGNTVARTRIINTGLVPHSNDLIALGSSSLNWSDLFLASGGVINFNNGDAVITHSTGVINVSTGTLQQGGSPVTTKAMVPGAITMNIDGGGSAITTGLKGYVTVPYGMTITSWTLLADVSGSIVIDVWKDTYANYPPLVADTITASAKPTLSSAIKNTSSTLTGWTTTVTAGDVLAFNVDSASTVTKVTLLIQGTRT